MKSFIITDKDAGQRTDRFILKTFDNLPRSLMYKEIRKKNIKINKTNKGRQLGGDDIMLVVAPRTNAPKSLQTFIRNTIGQYYKNTSN